MKIYCSHEAVKKNLQTDLYTRKLFSPPEIKVTPSSVIKGDKMMVRCDTRLDPLRGGTELHFAFYRDGRTVRGYDVSDTYRVRSSQLEDSGKYTCEVRMRSDTVRKMSDELYIQIHELFSPPEIKVIPSRLIEGDEMTVRCDTRLDPLRGGTELHFAFYRDGRTVRGYNVSDTYRVRSSQLEDSGKYTCEVRTRSDTVRKMSDGLYIQIHELFSPPEIKVTPSRVIEGDNMTVRCDTRLDPLRGGTELHFSFYRDGRTVRGYNVSDTYRVWSAQLEDSGKYTCEVRTRSDTVRKMSDGLYIQIHGLLEVDKRPEDSWEPNELCWAGMEDSSSSGRMLTVYGRLLSGKFSISKFSMTKARLGGVRIHVTEEIRPNVVPEACETLARPENMMVVAYMTTVVPT
ncbi:high affinity immunoglobulin gamma Fc receptor I-like [Aquarana catesbeiana]|uniref:high affinity immunoglobulin gamma Fc receptor I-like n=1 Tax=Aquarana catesbeiana TaxID=8400 RepID=UPI003CCA2640